MKLSVVYDGPLKAPIKAGQQVAELVVKTADMPAQRLPLVAESDVEEAGFFGRLWAGLRWLLGMA
jgi:D-alanyl-D-alanine carboxypeptidase (penicillin-binding protein 5/6)